MTKRFVARSALPAVLGLAAVLPFALLEALNRRAFQEGFPVALFGLLWLLSATFIAVFRTTLHVRENGVRLLLGLAVLGLIGWAWGAILVDQMPCFLGTPNCD